LQYLFFEEPLIARFALRVWQLWDVRVRGAQRTYESQYQVTSVAFADDHSQIYSGGIDNSIKVWDLRMDKVVFELEGHSDTITGNPCCRL